ncbi:MAG: hypothetical protein AABZ84_04955 [Pseudomonadota bacterium]
MTILPIPRDDAGLHRLQESNAARAAGTVAPVTATPSIEERPAEPASAASRPVEQSPNRRRTDRRHQHRRWARRAVLLDTRAQRERRRGERRGAGDAGASDVNRARPARGLDVLA